VSNPSLLHKKFRKKPVVRVEKPMTKEVAIEHALLDAALYQEDIPLYTDGKGRFLGIPTSVSPKASVEADGWTYVETTPIPENDTK
jgi:hypothetical protein